MTEEKEVAEAGTSAELGKMKGLFVESLIRTNRKIKEDRAISIVENAELIYKRKVEDMQMKLKLLKRDKDNMLDLSPETAGSLIVASDFDGEAFYKKDHELDIAIRNLQIEVDLAVESYNRLFKG